MFWKKKLKQYKGKNFYYSLRNKLKREKKITDDFEVVFNSLTLEELIGLKLELSTYNINNKLYNFPIWRNLDHIVKEACLMYALSCTRTKGEAALFLGLKENKFKDFVKKYKVENYFEEST
tara:strand:- start:68 stop:430 length:363 start_codon:yes stop_codon:yes gene_type:complete